MEAVCLALDKSYNKLDITLYPLPSYLFALRVTIHRQLRSRLQQAALPYSEHSELLR